jgi:hypothetical protein
MAGALPLGAGAPHPGVFLEKRSGGCLAIPRGHDNQPQREPQWFGGAIQNAALLMGRRYVMPSRLAGQ